MLNVRAKQSYGSACGDRAMIDRASPSEKEVCINVHKDPLLGVGMDALMQCGTD